MTSDEILIEFMQRRYDKWPDPVMRVELEEEVDHGWSEYTPGAGWSLKVKCFIDTGPIPYYTEYITEYETVKFINELCQFAANLKDGTL